MVSENVVSIRAIRLPAFTL